MYRGEIVSGRIELVLPVPCGANIIHPAEGDNKFDAWHLYRRKAKHHISTKLFYPCEYA